VYYERVDASAPAISAIRTDIAAFVGFARRGPLDTPVPLQSWRQAQAHFGTVTGSAFLGYAVRAFFENGGRRCWVVRVASRAEAGGASTAGITLFAASGRPIWRLSASSPGVWGDDLTVLVRPTSAAQTITIAAGSRSDASRVATTAGFVRGTLVHLRQDSLEAWRVVSEVDAVTGRLIWVHPDPTKRLGYDAPLDVESPRGFDPDRAISVGTVEYTVVVRERGRLVAQFENLHLIPEHPRYGPGLLAPLAVRLDDNGQASVPTAPMPLTIDDLRDIQDLRMDGLAAIEPLHVAPHTQVAGVDDARRLHLVSVGGLKAGTRLELLSPTAPASVVEPPFVVLFVDPASDNLVTLGGDGLTPAQLSAHAAAIAAGQRLAVRAVEGALYELPLEGGADGLALVTADDFIGEAVSPWDDDAALALKRRGIRALDVVDEVAIVAAPDILIQPIPPAAYAPLPPCCEPDPCLLGGEPTALRGPRAQGDQPPVFADEDVFRVQAALVQHCDERRDRVALIDPPLAAARSAVDGLSQARAWRSRFDSTYAAFYYPWLRVVDPLRSGGEPTRPIPPSGHVAGQFAQSDLAIGVHKAPANAPLVWAEDVTINVDEAVHGAFSPLGINVIRALGSRGMRVMGARTMSSDPDWRYVNVRRLMMMIEEAIDHSTRWVVFEPNDVATRTKVTLAIASFLLALWQRGALAGATPAEAFFVRCDETNNPAAERSNGRFVADVGIAPSYPLEFIVLRVGRADNELEIVEMPRSGGVSWHS
jgi:phage tail sheath protein FI